MKSRQSWVVHKFGGTSVGNWERYQNAAKIILERDARGSRDVSESRAVVVSAMKGATDALIDLVERARKRDESYLKRLESLRTWHFETLERIAEGEARAALASRLESDFRDISEVLRGAYLARSASERIVELISGYGEIWSAQFLNGVFQRLGVTSRWLDARDVLVVEPGERNVVVNWEESARRLGHWLHEHPTDLLVITGFVASTADGIPTTLRRNGSDYSASIFGALLEASKIVIWTDVDGVLSADPRLVPEAVVLSEMSYQEVTELAYFGAKVVHPATMQPAISRRIPIWIKNTFNPEFEGTLIHATSQSDSPVKGFSAIDGMAVVNVEGTGMIGVPGVAERLFGALRSSGVSVVMISQASSEHSICFVIPEAQAELARRSVEKAFIGELQAGLIQKVDVSPGCSILAVVGDNMAHHPGIAARFFSALGDAGINIRAIAQGSSERNISALISSPDASRALRAVHSAFYLSDQTIALGVIGSGLIGSAFLRQLKAQLDFLRRERGIDIRVRAIATSKKMWLDGTDERGLAPELWDVRNAEGGQVADLETLVKHLTSGHLPHMALIDATASPELPGRYVAWLERGFHLITPNKKANAGKMETYRAIRKGARSRSRHFLYSTNVGAGLPVLQTLRDLHQTGDRILAIEGILSGTLSYIFNSFDGKRPFSEIVLEAKAKGYTEPDPREDLSGMDVARKLVILAREVGWELELENVRIESLVPEKLRDGSVAEFLERLPSEDAAMSARLAEAAEKGEVLRYVGHIDGTGTASVSLRSYPKTHAFSRVNGSDNMVAFRTQRYDAQPLVIQGPGAGPEVTAAGVFADLLRLASYLGARP